MTLYDGKDFKAITENYVVRWTKEGLMSDLDQMFNLRVLFTVSTFCHLTTYTLNNNTYLPFMQFQFPFDHQLPFVTVTVTY